MVEAYDEVKVNQVLAKRVLAKMKDIEKENAMHTVRINKKTIVCCKNKDRLNDYKNTYK